MHSKGKKCFEGVFEIKEGIVNMFYKGFINDEENNVVVKQVRVYFRAEHIHAFFGLDGNEVEQVILKNPTLEDMQDALKTTSWEGTNWDKTTTRKHQLFLHNLNIEVSVWLFFMKKKLM